MVYHGSPWSTMVDYGRPCFVKWPPMVDHGLRPREKNKKVKFSLKRKSLLFHGMPILRCKFYFMQCLYNTFIDMHAMPIDICPSIMTDI